MVDQLTAAQLNALPRLVLKGSEKPQAKTSEKSTDKIAAKPNDKAPSKTSEKSKSGSFGFHDILSALNPLQYIPVVGTVYRSATNDTIPENTRIIGSMVVSFLTGGPIGVATNAAATALEKFTGVDPEKIGHSLLAKLGIGHEDTFSAPTAVAAAKPSGKSDISAKEIKIAEQESQPALTTRQLAAYGVKTSASGDLTMGDVSGADVLNTIELRQIAMQSQGDWANSAYSALHRQDLTEDQNHLHA